MSRRRTIVKAEVACVLVAGVAAALIVAASRTWALPGDSITNPESPFGVGFHAGVSVGNHVFLIAPAPTVAEGNTITITAIELNEASRDIHLVDARLYQSKDSKDGNLQLAWGTQLDGSESDPRRRPSVPYVGTPLSRVERSDDEFAMFEFAVCGPGDLEVKSVKVTYMDGWIRYQQLIFVNYNVTNAQPSAVNC